MDNLTVTPRVVFRDTRYGGFNRQEAYKLFANRHTTTRPAIYLDEREQFLRLDEAFEDETVVVDTVVKYDTGNAFDVTYAVSYAKRDILVSRDASALAGSVTVDLGLPDAAVLLPSNLRDTTDLKQMSHELRLNASTDASLQWVAGLFYADTERNYAQHLPTPGYDFFLDANRGPGTSDAVRNGFADRDAPYVSYLPYDIRQIAVFGAATYGLTDRLDVSLGGRWYRWKEERMFTSGGFFFQLGQ